MKKLLALLISAAFFMPVMAEEKAAPETKKVCIDSVGKDGKPVIDAKTKKPKQDCKTVKVHKKFEGTKIEDAKKK
jgi:hypothetical protein